MILKVIGIILVMCGVNWIYDSRRINRKFFNGMGDQNEGTLGLKIIGMIFSVVGGLILFLL